MHFVICKRLFFANKQHQHYSISDGIKKTTRTTYTTLTTRFTVIYPRVAFVVFVVLLFSFNQFSICKKLFLLSLLYLLFYYTESFLYYFCCRIR